MRYKIKEESGFSGTRVFSVRDLKLAVIEDFAIAHVWVDEHRVNCAICQTPLCGMSGSCCHVKAVKRYLVKEKG